MSLQLDQTSVSRPVGRKTADRHANQRGVADWLCLAATPIFGIMALLTALSGTDMICMASPGLLPGGGMVPMYALMSVFHLTPWLKLLGSR